MAGELREISCVISGESLFRVGTHLSVTQKLQLTAIFATSIALVVAGAALLGFEAYIFRHERAKDLHALALTLAAGGGKFLAGGDSEAARELLASLASDETVTSATVFDGSGKVFASYQRKGTKSSGAQTGPQGISHAWEGHIEQCEPIASGGQVVGSVYVKSDPAGVRNRALQYAGALCILLPVAVLAAAPVVRRMSDEISRPLRDLAWTAKFVTLQHDYSVRANKASNDEVGHLVDAFNQMLEEIQSGTEELRVSHAELETRVAQRTRELQAEVSERRNAEARSSAIVESALDGLVGTDAEGRIIEFNPAAERMYGYSKEQVLGKLFYESIVPERLREFCKNDLSKYIRERKSDVVGRHVEMAGLRADGSEFPIEIAVTDFGERVPDSSSTVMSAFVRDITERKRAEAELQQAKEAAERASRAKSEFLANMSHEIRTPMNGILGMTDLALDANLAAEQREYIEMAKSSAVSLLEVINDILDFSKVEAGKLEIISDAFQLRAAVNHIVRSFAHRAEKKSLELTTEIEDGVPDEVIGDEGRLQQVLINLIGNAIKFTAKGIVTVHVSAAPGSRERVVLRFTVRDTGIGISREEQARVFEPFMQADGSTTRKYGGTGLGLTISARLVKLMNGKMWLESNPGEGSAFHFTIECEKAAARSLETDPSAAHKGPDGDGSRAPSRAGKLRILVVEDNPVNRKVAVRFLERFGHTVETAENGLRALDCLRAQGGQRFDVVFMDVQMPEMDGFEATKCIRDDEQSSGGNCRQPIIAMTAHAMTGDRERCLSAGMDGYVSKPIRPAELQREIERVLIALCHTGQESARPENLAVRNANESTQAGIAATEIFDAQGLRDRVQGNAELLGELIHIFLEDLPKRLEEIRGAITDMNLARIERAAHTLKGTAGLMSANRLLSAAREIEFAARAGHRGEIPALFARAVEESERLKLQLSSHRCEVEA